MPAWASLAVSSVFLILLYDWVNVSVGSPIRSGLIVALSQIVLVDVLYVMNGTRGIAAWDRRSERRRPDRRMDSGRVRLR